MRNVNVLAGAIALAALAWAWPARAEERPVAERLQTVEQRLAALEQKVVRLEQGWDVVDGLVREAPNLLKARLAANETSAILALRNLVSAQAQFQQSAKADEDQDGTGEHGGFLELSGAAAGRMSAPLVPPVLGGAFRVLNESGEASRSGYLFQIFLCGEEGGGIAESQKGFEGARLHADTCETTWCCYAWPVLHGTSGQRTFCVNQSGDVLATDAPAYSGSGRGPRPDAAFRARGRITGDLALGTKGNDLNTWVLVN